MSIPSAQAVPLSGCRRLSRDSELLLYIGGFAFAVVVALFSGEVPVQTWAPFAALGTATGAALIILEPVVTQLGVVRRRHPCALPAVVASLVTVLPLGFQAVRSIEVIEVGILERGAARWLASGSFYPNAEALATATEAADYNVYFPLLVLSGIPSALLGESAFTDARWYLLSGSLLALWSTGRSLRTLLLFCALSPVGMVAAAGMTDLLPITLVCAALVFATRAHPLRTGIAAGLASGAKLLAWPAVPVLLIALYVRQGASAARTCFVAVGGCLVVSVLLPAMVDLEAFWRNTIALPLALEPVTLVARTPLPGYLLSSSGELGRTTAMLLLGVAALGMLVWLLVRPPANMLAIATRLAVGWTLLFSLAPATRIGYFVFPLTVLAWAVLVRSDKQRSEKSVLDKADADLVHGSARLRQDDARAAPRASDPGRSSADRHH